MTMKWKKRKLLEMEKMKKKYISPEILEEVKLEMDGQILAASHVNEPIEKDVEVVSMGQKTDNFDFTWEK